MRGTMVANFKYEKHNYFEKIRSGRKMKSKSISKEYLYIYAFRVYIIILKACERSL